MENNKKPTSSAKESSWMHDVGFCVGVTITTTGKIITGRHQSGPVKRPYEVLLSSCTSGLKSGRTARENVRVFNHCGKVPKTCTGSSSISMFRGEDTARRSSSRNIQRVTAETTHR